MPMESGVLERKGGMDVNRRRYLPLRAPLINVSKKPEFFVCAIGAVHGHTLLDCVVTRLMGGYTSECADVVLFSRPNDSMWVGVHFYSSIYLFAWVSSYIHG